MKSLLVDITLALTASAAVVVIIVSVVQVLV